MITAALQPFNNASPSVRSWWFQKNGKTEQYINLSICSGATANCQLNTVYNFSGPLSMYIHGKISKKEFIDFMRYIAKITRPLFLIDLNLEYEKNFEQLFSKRKIIMKSPYISSNGSNMIIYIINPAK